VLGGESHSATSLPGKKEKKKKENPRREKKKAFLSGGKG
jgi:hypothetical protein